METPVPFRPSLTKLTEDGCCTNPWWAPDSRRVLYYDKPAEGLGGMWALDVETHQPAIIAAQPGVFSDDLSLVAMPAAGGNGLSLFRAGEDRPYAVVRAAASSASWSPDGQRVLYTIRPAQTIGGPLLLPVELRLVNADGGGDRRVGSLIGAGVVDWLPDGSRVVVTGRASPSVDSGIWLLDPDTGALTEILRRRRINGIQVAPAGNWIAYQVTFDADGSENGVWVMRLDGSDRRKLDVTGSYRWDVDGQALIVIPVRPSAADSYTVYRLPVDSHDLQPLTDPASVDLRIANYDWQLSPDCRRIAYVSSVDYAIWMLQLRP